MITRIIKSSALLVQLNSCSAAEPPLPFTNKFLPLIPTFRLKQAQAQLCRLKQQEPEPSTEPPFFPEDLWATSAEPQTQWDSLKTTDNLTQPGENPWKMCLWSKMCPGKPHTGSWGLCLFIFCLPHPSGNGELRYTEDCTTGDLAFRLSLLHWGHFSQCLPQHISLWSTKLFHLGGELYVVKLGSSVWLPGLKSRLQDF